MIQLEELVGAYMEWKFCYRWVYLQFIFETVQFNLMDDYTPVFVAAFKKLISQKNFWILFLNLFLFRFFFPEIYIRIIFNFVFQFISIFLLHD